MREHLPSGCAVVRSLDLQSLEIIAKEALARAVPVVSMDVNDTHDLHDDIAAEVSKLWEEINPEQIAFIVKRSSETDWQDPDILEYFYGMPVEEIILDCVQSFIMETVEDIVLECLGPGENYGFFVSLKTFDDKVQEERIREISESMDPDGVVFDEEDDEDDGHEEPEEVEITKMLSDSTWCEKNFVKGYIMEVTGENAAVYLEDNGQEKLVIPRILQLLYKVRKAVPGKWYEHKPGWRYRLVPEQVADTV